MLTFLIGSRNLKYLLLWGLIMFVEWSVIQTKYFLLLREASPSINKHPLVPPHSGVLYISVERNLTSKWFRIHFSSRADFTVGSVAFSAKCDHGWKWMAHFCIWSPWHQESRLNHAPHWWVAEQNSSLHADSMVFCSLLVFSGGSGEGYKTCDSVLHDGLGVFKHNLEIFSLQ